MGGGSLTLRACSVRVTRTKKMRDQGDELVRVEAGGQGDLLKRPAILEMKGRVGEDKQKGVFVHVHG